MKSKKTSKKTSSMLGSCCLSNGWINDTMSMMFYLVNKLDLSKVELCKVVSLHLSSRVIGVQQKDKGQDDWLWPRI